MKLPFGERALATILVVPTAIAVILLAIVQYRWSADVSSATSMRLADSLQMSMMSWHLNLFRDLSDVCVRLRLESDHLDGPGLAQMFQRFDEQQQASEYPDLVASAYVVASDRRLPPVRWDRGAGRFATLATAAPMLDRVRDKLARGATDLAPVAAAGSSTYTPVALGDWRFDPGLPGLLRPVTTDVALFDGRPSRGADAEAWIVLELDPIVLGGTVLPALANRYFTGADGLDYQVALVAGTNPRRLLYSSEPSFAVQDPSDADGRMNLFGRPADGGAGSPIYVFHEPTESTGPPIAVSTAWFPLLGDTPRADDWELVVRHRRGGALGTFVAEINRRNLAISFGLLLLLVISGTVWIIISNRAQRLARLQMNFVTAVSHDLRTPITIISSAADNIARGVVRQEQQVAQYGTVIGKQARKLSELVEQVLLFAAVRESSHRYILRPIEVAEVVDTTLAASAELIQAARVTVERNVESDLPRVMSDPLGLSQCLQNLITNALKYGGDRRWLGVRAALVQNGDGPEIELSICDKGIGIEASDLRYIFEPFYRSPAVVAAQIHGTGLGLSVARGVAEAMNGRLTVVSVPGEGSTFTLHLPCALES